MYVAGETRWAFRRLDGLCAIRARDPDGSCPRQTATLFAARTRHVLAPQTMPNARVVRE